MKTCPNCRAVWADDYNGQCADCGAPLGGVQGNTQGDLAFAFARQVNQARREDAVERQLKSARGNDARERAYNDMSLPDSIVQVARGFIVVDESKLREAGDAT